MNDFTRDSGAGKMGLGPISISLGVTFLGMLLIVASLLPLGNHLQEALWTKADSDAYSRVSQEYHRISYETPQRAGLTEEQLAAQIEKTKARFEALRAKLQHAQQQPVAWKRFLLWTGALLTLGGFLGHRAGVRS